MGISITSETAQAQFDPIWNPDASPSDVQSAVIEVTSGQAPDGEISVTLTPSPAETREVEVTFKTVSREAYTVTVEGLGSITDYRDVETDLEGDTWEIHRPVNTNDYNNRLRVYVNGTRKYTIDVTLSITEETITVPV